MSMQLAGQVHDLGNCIGAFADGLAEVIEGIQYCYDLRYLRRQIFQRKIRGAAVEKVLCEKHDTRL